MAVRVTGLAVAFLAHVVLSRVLGASEYGHYVIALGWAMVLVLPARLGLDNSVLRFATVYREQGRMGDLRGLIFFSLAAIALTSLSIAATLLLARGVGLGPLRPISSTLLTGVALLIPFSALIGWLSSLVRTANRIFASQFYDQVLRPLLFIAAIGVVVLTGRRLDAGSAMVLTAATVGIAAVGLAIYTRAAFAGLSAARISFARRHEWLSVSWILFLTAAVQELLNQVDIILLGLVADATQAAHFAAAWRLASLVPFGLIAIATVSAPLIASAHSRGDLGELARIVRLNARFASLSALILALALGISGRFALTLFGPGFEAAYPTLLILLAGGLVNSFTGSVGYCLTLTGHQREALIILIAALVLSILLNLLLIPALGATGSAIASTAALSFWNLTMAVYVRRRIGVDATAIGRPPIVKSN
jgi:O-antigen/teichoic acid export membrane protein